MRLGAKGVEDCEELGEFRLVVVGVDGVGGEADFLRIAHLVLDATPYLLCGEGALLLPLHPTLRCTWRGWG